MSGIADTLWMQRIIDEQQARKTQIKQAWEAYFGRYPVPLKTKKGQPNDNVTINFCRLIANKAATSLFGKEPEFELKDKAADTWLTEAWRANRKMQFLIKLGLNGAVCGHVFVKLMPNQPYPKLVNLSPEYVDVVWDPNDIDKVWRYIVQYPAIAPNGKPITVRQITEQSDTGRWVIIDQVAEGNGVFITRETINWPWPWSPIIACQNLPSPNEYFGIADIEADELALNNAINFVLSNTNRIIRYHAHPKTWGKGFQAEQVKQAVDEMMVFPSEQAELHNLEMQSDLASSIEYYKRLKEALHETARIPEIATGKVDSLGALSGVALQILYAPLIETTESKRLTYGEMLEELCGHMLEMSNQGRDVQVEIHWPELLPSDPLQERQIALLDQQLGVSKDTLLDQLGYDPKLEKKKREESNAELGAQLLAALPEDSGAGQPGEVPTRPTA